MTELAKKCDNSISLWLIVLSKEGILVVPLTQLSNTSKIMTDIVTDSV